MATTMDQLVEAVKYMAERQAELGAMLTQHQQAMSGMNANVPRSSKDWADVSMFRNVKPFGGEQASWEEFAEKVKSQIAAGDTTAARVLDNVETKIGEQELEEEDYPTYLAEDYVTEEQIVLMGAKMHNLLLNLTTG